MAGLQSWRSLGLPGRGDTWTGAWTAWLRGPKSSQPQEGGGAGDTRPERGRLEPGPK